MGDKETKRVNAVGSLSLFPWLDALQGTEESSFFSKDRKCLGSAISKANIKNIYFFIADQKGVNITNFHFAHTGFVLYGYMSLANIFLRLGAIVFEHGKLTSADLTGNWHILAHAILFCAAMLTSLYFKYTITDIAKKSDVYMLLMRSIFVFLKEVDTSSDLYAKIDFMNSVVSSLQFDENYEIMSSIMPDMEIHQEPTIEQGREVTKQVLSTMQSKTVNGASRFFQLSDMGKAKFCEIQKLVNENL